MAMSEPENNVFLKFFESLLQVSYKSLTVLTWELCILYKSIAN